MEWNPEDYARNSRAQMEWARELISRLQLSGNETVLDVGCGNGGVTSELAEAVPEGFVLGIDRSSAFVRYATEHYPPEAFSNLRFEQMDARNLASDRRFDVVFSNAALHWVDDHTAFLEGVARLLGPAGRLIVSCGGEGNASGVAAVIEEIVQSEPWTNYFESFTFPYYFYSTTDYEHWLAQAGFTATHLDLVEKDMTHPGRDGLAGWIRTTWIPYTQQVPEELRDRFVAECVDAYLETVPLDEAGRSHVRMVRLEVEAHLLLTEGP